MRARAARRSASNSSSIGRAFSTTPHAPTSRARRLEVGVGGVGGVDDELGRPGLGAQRLRTAPARPRRRGGGRGSRRRAACAAGRAAAPRRRRPRRRRRSPARRAARPPGRRAGRGGRRRRGRGSSPSDPPRPEGPKSVRVPAPPGSRAQRRRAVGGLGPARRQLQRSSRGTRDSRRFAGTDAPSRTGCRRGRAVRRGTRRRRTTKRVGAPRRGPPAGRPAAVGGKAAGRPFAEERRARARGFPGAIGGVDRWNAAERRTLRQFPCWIPTDH